MAAALDASLGDTAVEYRLGDAAPEVNFGDTAVEYLLGASADDLSLGAGSEATRRGVMCVMVSFCSNGLATENNRCSESFQISTFCATPLFIIRTVLVRAFDLGRSICSGGGGHGMAICRSFFGKVAERYVRDETGCHRLAMSCWSLEITVSTG